MEELTKNKEIVFSFSVLDDNLLVEIPNAVTKLENLQELLVPLLVMIMYFFRLHS